MDLQEKYKSLISESFADCLSKNMKMKVDEYDKGLKCIEIFENFRNAFNSACRPEDELLPDCVYVDVFDISFDSTYEVVIRFGFANMNITDSTAALFNNLMKSLIENNIDASIHSSNSGYVVVDVSCYPMDEMFVEEFREFLGGFNE